MCPLLPTSLLLNWSLVVVNVHLNAACLPLDATFHFRLDSYLRLKDVSRARVTLENKKYG